MADHSAMKLGKKEAKKDSRTLRLASYLPATLPPAPDAMDWFSGITDWGMMKNDLFGCCTISGVGHACQTWSAATGPCDTPDDDEIMRYYSLWDGYVPGDPSTDNGGIELDVLNRWRKEGFAGRELLAYADPAPQNFDHIRQSVYLFGGVYIGLQLPLTAQRQSTWDLVPNGGYNSAAGSWGGHAVFVNGYDGDSLTCVTWGAQKKMTLAFWEAYCDESHTLLSKTWMERASVDFHFDKLQDDLAEVTR